MQDGIIILVLYAAIAFVAYKILRPKQKRKSNLHKVRNEIDRVYQIKQEIEACEDLITDIQLSGDKRLKCFNITWTDVSGNTHDYNLWVGNDKHLKSQFEKLILEERENLSYSLTKEIEKLSIRSRKTVRKTTTNSSRGE